MPLVYRAMTRDDDGLPTVEQTAKGLGVRTGVDIDVDQHGNAIERQGNVGCPELARATGLAHPKAVAEQGTRRPCVGKDLLFPNRHGPISAGPFAQGLELTPDSTTHGCITPATAVPLAQYQCDLAATRPDWQVDET